MYLCGNALDVLKTLKTGSVQTCVTSPPYYGLRDYGTATWIYGKEDCTHMGVDTCEKCGAKRVDMQIGLEPTPEEFIQRLVDVFSEVWRVLADDGTLWLNIADSYAGSGRGVWANTTAQKETYVAPPGSVQAKMAKKWDGIKPKDLIGIPWMLAFALRDAGWYLRDEIIWHKPNAMPESTTDRCTKANEKIFMLSKQQNYFYNYEAIEEPAVGFDKNPPNGSLGAFGQIQQGRRKGNAKTFRGGGAYTGGKSFKNNTPTERESRGNTENTTGLRRKRNVWTVATTGYSEAHYATFPPELIRPCILAGSAPGDTVLDPFGGSGTTGAVAQQEGRNFILIDLNPANIEMAKRRVKYTGHRQLALAESGE